MGNISQLQAAQRGTEDADLPARSRRYCNGAHVDARMTGQDAQCEEIIRVASVSVEKDIHHAVSPLSAITPGLNLLMSRR